MKLSLARKTLVNEQDKYWETIGTLRSDDATAARSKKKTNKKTMGLTSKTTPLHVNDLSNTYQ